MVILFYILTSILAIEAVITTLGTFKFRKFFLNKISINKQPDQNPRVALLVPFRGLETNFQKIATSWFQQDYSNYHVFFILESRDDPAISVLSTFENATIFVAGTATDCGQKIHNLKFAIERIPDEFEIFAFADSDGRVENEWLGSLVQELLLHPQDGVTGYRWFFPEKSSTFSQFRAIWNSAVLTLFSESGKGNFAWGGAMALFRKTFEETNVVSFWNGSLSDDLGLTKALRTSGRKIRFVPQAIAVTEDGISGHAFFSWIARQLLMTKLYHHRLWLGTFIYHMIWSVWFIVGIIFSPIQFLVAFIVFQICQGVKAEIRMECMTKLLGKSAGSRLLAWILSPVMSLINVVAMWSNVFTRKVCWRGIQYRVKGPNSLDIISRVGAEKLL
ncbi:glycosyltransferase family 2 protein [bacterium]|nr:glycosyltransferase family 2 protein [bacterium]